MLKLINGRHVLQNGVIKLINKNRFEVRSGHKVLYYASPIAVRFASTGTGIDESNVVNKVPDWSIYRDVFDDVTNLAQPVLTSEPTFSSLGLGGWSPVGIVQNCFEFLHIAVGIPWWGTIMIGTVLVRTLIFPLVIKTQRSVALMNNHLPELQVLQMKLTEARKNGNILEAQQHAQEIRFFMIDRGLNPLKSLTVALVQTPLFISFFFGLNGMVNCPVESMAAGGLWWFKDLTVPDPFYILPLVTSATLWLTLKLGADGIDLNAPHMKHIKFFFKAAPFIMIPFTIKFSGAILVYWTSNNFISLCQAALLKAPPVRAFFKIPPTKKYTSENLPIDTSNQKGFMEGFKESLNNMKLSQDLADRERINSMISTKTNAKKIKKQN